MYPQSPYLPPSQMVGALYPQDNVQRPVIIPFLSNGFLFIQSMTLLISILIGLILFFYDFTIYQLFLYWFIVGGVYLLTVPFLLGSWERLDDHFESETQYVLFRYNKIIEANMNRTRQNMGWDPVDGQIAAIQYQISPLINKRRIPKNRKYLFYLLFFLPIWPLVFFFILYKLMSQLSEHDHIFNGIYNELDSASRVLGLEMDTLPTVQGTVSSSREIQLYSFIAVFNIVGFLMVFYHPCAGFFGLFWSYMLIRDINKHSQKHLDVMEIKKDRNYQIMFQNVYSSLQGNLPINPGMGVHTQIPKAYQTANYSFLLLYVVFAAGATSGFIAMFTNTLYMLGAIPIALFSANLFIIFVVTIIAPVVEESGKIFALWILKTEGTFKLKTIHWVLLGTIAGLGFALLENYVYFQRFWVDYSPATSYHLLLMRFQFPVHMLASATAGFGIAEWKRTENARLFFIWLIVAMFIHGSYNYLVTVAVR
jgi:RsiW-degrading membrane proteinase PrsW (M82 family)